MSGTSTSILRRMHDNRFATRYFIGQGIDIGAGRDPLRRYGFLYPLMNNCRDWDLPDGDAQYLATIADDSMDFVHSSHCLEHMLDPMEALRNWLRVLKPGGHLIVTVPDEDLYEQGVFPSTWNRDHKWTFTLHKITSWSSKSINIIELLPQFSAIAQTVKVELLDATFQFDHPQRYDQTLSSIGECAVEFIMRKLPQKEIAQRGRLPLQMADRQQIDSIPRELEAARQHYQAGQFDSAAEIFGRILTLQADSPLLFKEYGNTLLSLGRLAEAEQAFTQATRLNPDFGEAYNNLGYILRISGRFAEAEVSLLKALKLLPESPEILNNYGLLLLDMAQPERADQMFRQAIILKADYAQAYYNRGKALESLGRHDAAKKCFTKSDELETESVSN